MASHKNNNLCLGYPLALLVGLIVVAIFPWISIGFLSGHGVEFDR